MTTPTEAELLTMDGWPGGLNNRVRETESNVVTRYSPMGGSKFLRKALNVDLTVDGHPLRRRGYALTAAGYAHSMWSTNALGLICWVSEGQLFVGTSVENAAPIADVNKYLAMSFVHINDTIYYSNGQELGEITYAGAARNWGIPVPATPSLAIIQGAPAGAVIPPGDRLVAATYVDAYGREGGASAPAAILASVIGVTVQSPLPAGVVSARIYASNYGSDILYHATTIQGGSSGTVPGTAKGAVLDTLNLSPPRAGQLVAHHNGRAYVARNDYVAFTEPLRYGLMRPSQGIYTFPANVTLLQPSTDGVYVGTSKGIVFISGADPYDVRQTFVSPYAPVSGAVSRVPGEKFGISVEEVPIWWGKDGALVVGLPGGQLQQVTRDRLAVPEYAAGAVSLREREGMSHIVSSLRQGGMDNPMGASDSVVADVRRNCIVLNT